MDIVSRSNVKISDSDIEKLVINWTGMKEQSINVFCKLLQSIGIITPITLSNFNDEDNSFDCITADGKTLSLALRYRMYGDTDDFSQIIVKERELCSYYNYHTWYKNIHLELQSTVIKRNNSRLHNYYCEFFCNRDLTLPDDYYVTVSVDEPEPRNKNNIRVLNSKLSIENYLLSLTFPCTAQDIYDKVMELYGFDDSIISKIPFIKVSVEKILSKRKNGDPERKRIVSIIFVKYGKIDVKN